MTTDTTTYDIFCWYGGELPGKARPNPDGGHLIDLTSAEILALTATYDVMILGAGALHPDHAGRGSQIRFREAPAIWLDQKGGRFRVR